MGIIGGGVHAEFVRPIKMHEHALRISEVVIDAVPINCRRLYLFFSNIFLVSLPSIIQTQHGTCFEKTAARSITWLFHVSSSKLGGANVILATAPNAQAISGLVDGLAPSGKLLVPAAPLEPLSINVFSLISKRSSVAGWYSGTARDSQDTLEFRALSDVHPMIEKYPLDRVAEGYEQMHSGKVRFRVVLIFGE